MNGQQLRGIAIGTLIMAATSAFADAFWAAAVPEHRAIYGLVHGALVLAVLGATLAWLAHATTPLRWGVLGLAIGAAAAAVFYLLYPFIGIGAMLIAWMGLWLAFALVTNMAAAVPETGARPLVRGLLAAVLSGIGFWAISGIWLGPHEPGLLYWRNLVAWAIAFAPGFLALLAARPSAKA